jgi:addiction module HigA family antidote
MIESIRHRGLRQLFVDDNPRGVNPEHVRKVRQILGLLQAARTVADLDLRPSGCTRSKAICKASGRSPCGRTGGSSSASRTATLSTWTSSTIIEGDGAMPLHMKNAPHPGELIGDTLAELGVSVTAAAKGLGITRQQLHNLIAGRSGVTAEMAVRLEKALGSTADTWLRMQMNYDLAQVRSRAGSIKVKRIEAA